MTLLPCTPDEIAMLSKGQCPDCEGEEFLFGPSGGLSLNVRCANSKCGSGFNLSSPFPEWAERISEPHPLRPG